MFDSWILGIEAKNLFFKVRFLNLKSYWIQVHKLKLKYVVHFMFMSAVDRYVFIKYTYISHYIFRLASVNIHAGLRGENPTQNDSYNEGISYN